MMKRFVCGSFVASVLTASLSAQATNPGVSAAAAEESVVLSPFVVNAEEDTGYAAQNTLAGSRMRTSLKDIAAAISPMTAEFLADIAATNVIDATEYGLNTRVETDDGRAAGPVGDIYNGGFRDIRIRGLPGGSRTVDYYRTLIGVDLYNIERLDVSRGPNSILYGFGSPAGVVNASSKRAQTNKPSYTAVFRVDDWGGDRESFDANIPIVKNKVALRLVGLRARDGSWRATGFDDQNRLYITGTWRIDQKTTLTANYEQGTQNRYVPRPFFGVDLMSPWTAVGEPSFNNFDPTLKPGSVGTPGNPFRDSGTLTAPGTKELSGSDYVVVMQDTGTLQNYRRFAVSQSPSPIKNDFTRGLSNPKATPEANWMSGHFRTRTYSVTLQRELLRGLDFEAGFSKQTLNLYTTDLASWNTYGVIGDPNTYFPDGTRKPDGARYYYENNGAHRIDPQSIFNARATLAYERMLKWVGRLRLAGLSEYNKTTERNQLQQQYWMNGPSLTSGGAFNDDPYNSVNRVYYRTYLPNLAVTNDPNFRIPGETDVTHGVTYRDPATSATRTIYGLYSNRAQGNVNYWDETMQSYMGVAQLFTLKDHLTITGGLRTDKLKHYENQAIRDPEATAAGHLGVWAPVQPPDTPTDVRMGHTRTLGGVLSLTPWASVFVNTSDSANVPGGVKVFKADPTDTNAMTLAPLRSGKTLDYGLKFSLLHDRIFVTATKFETKSFNETGFSGFTARGDIVAIWKALSDSKALPANDQAIADAMYQSTNATQGYTLDSRSSGYELEAVGTLLPNWTVSANWSKTQSVRTNIASEVRRHIDAWKQMWLKYGDYALTQNSALPGAELAPSSSDFNTPDVIRATGDFTVNTDSIKERVVDMENNFYNNPYLFEGKRFIGDNKYNLNFRTRYDFKTGMLNGFSVGTGARVRRGRVAGAISDYEFVPGSSYTDTWNGRRISKVTTIYAKDQTLWDLQVNYRRAIWKNRIKWTIQLNVNNVLNARDLIVNNTDLVGAPLTYRYQDPRQYILTNTFQF